MKKLLFVLIATCYLWAVNPYAICPYDGEQANFTGSRRENSCEYRHMHADKTKVGFVEHRFWTNCGD
jgi:hypothetical protein